MPTIVFQVNLNPDASSFPIPENKDPLTYQAEVAAQRVTWLPNNLLNNRELKNGVQFTVTGDEAVYLRNLVNSGQINFLTIVSTTH
jgi:hypothetical protein